MNESCLRQIRQRPPDCVAVDIETSRKAGLGGKLRAGRIAARSDLSNKRVSDRSPKGRASHGMAFLEDVMGRGLPAPHVPF
jgi:hypothetical protein